MIGGTGGAASTRTAWSGGSVRVSRGGHSQRGSNGLQVSTYGVGRIPAAMEVLSRRKYIRGRSSSSGGADGGDADGGGGGAEREVLYDSSRYAASNKTATTTATKAHVVVTGRTLHADARTKRDGGSRTADATSTGLISSSPDGSAPATPSTQQALPWLSPIASTSSSSFPNGPLRAGSRRNRPLRDNSFSAKGGKQDGDVMQVMQGERYRDDDSDRDHGGGTSSGQEAAGTGDNGVVYQDIMGQQEGDGQTDEPRVNILFDTRTSLLKRSAAGSLARKGSGGGGGGGGDGGDGDGRSASPVVAAATLAAMAAVRAVVDNSESESRRRAFLEQPRSRTWSPGRLDLALKGMMEGGLIDTSLAQKAGGRGDQGITSNGGGGGDGDDGRPLGSRSNRSDGGEYVGTSTTDQLTSSQGRHLQHLPHQHQHQQQRRHHQSARQPAPPPSSSATAPELHRKASAKRRNSTGGQPTPTSTVKGKAVTARHVGKRRRPLSSSTEMISKAAATATRRSLLELQMEEVEVGERSERSERSGSGSGSVRTSSSDLEKFRRGTLIRLQHFQRRKQEEQREAEDKDRMRREKFASLDLEGVRAVAAERVAAVSLRASHVQKAKIAEETSKKKEVALKRTLEAQQKIRRRSEIYAINAIMREKFEADYKAYSEDRKKKAAAETVTAKKPSTAAAAV